MSLLFGAVDRLSRFCGYAMMVVFLILVSDMMYEVVSRRVFNTPTLWAYDVAYMSNAASSPVRKASHAEATASEPASHRVGRNSST